MIAYWLSFYCLLIAYWLSCDCLLSACWAIGDYQLIVDWLPIDCLLIDSTESHDNPFVLDGELQRKADFIIQHSTISRHTLTIADPDQLRTVTEPADQLRTVTEPAHRVRTITETADPGPVRLIPVSANQNQNVENGINHKADIRVISGKELEQEPEMLFVNGLAPPDFDKSVSCRGGVESTL